MLLLLCFGLLAPVVDSNGLLLLQKLKLIPAPKSIMDELISDKTGIVVCVVWICIVCLMIWSVWLESKITIDMWGGSKLFKRNEVNDLPIKSSNPLDRAEPRRIDRRFQRRDQNQPV